MQLLGLRSFRTAGVMLAGLLAYGACLCCSPTLEFHVLVHMRCPVTILETTIAGI